MIYGAKKGGATGRGAGVYTSAEDKVIWSQIQAIKGAMPQIQKYYDTLAKGAEQAHKGAEKQAASQKKVATTTKTVLLLQKV